MDDKNETKSIMALLWGWEHFFNRLNQERIPVVFAREGQDLYLSTLKVRKAYEEKKKAERESK